MVKRMTESARNLGETGEGHAWIERALELEPEDQTENCTDAKETDNRPEVEQTDSLVIG